MAAEVFVYNPTGDKLVEGRIVDETQMYWIGEFGDGEGNTTFIHAGSKQIQVFTAKIDEEDDASIIFCITNELAVLNTGEKYKATLINNKDRRAISIYVRNIGSSGLRPMLN